MNIVEGEVKNGFIHFGNIVLSEDVLPVKLINSNKVLIGVRSENIITSSDPNYHFNSVKFSADITFFENLGSHKNLYFKFANTEFCATIKEDKDLSGRVDFSINPRNLHFFDYKTQMSLET